MKLVTSPGFGSHLHAGPALLVGCSYGQHDICLIQAVPTASNDGNACNDDLQQLLPYGLRVCGAYSTSSTHTAGSFSQPHVEATKKGDTIAYRVQQNGQASSVAAAVESTADGPVALPAGCILARCSMPVTLDVYHPAMSAGSSGSSLAQAVQAASQKLQQQIQSMELALLVCTRSSAAQQVVMPSTAGTLADLLGASSKERVIQLQPLVSSSSSSSSASTSASSTPAAAPSFSYQQAAPGSSIQHHSICLSLDILCYLPSSTACASLASAIIKPALLQQLQQAVSTALQQDKIVPIAAHHFLPPGYSHYVTVLYPTLSPDPELAEAKLKDRRLQLHKLLGLPIDRPALRLANVADPAALGQDAQQQDSSGRLLDVHLTLPEPPLGGTSYTIDGSYGYYHYMQDRFDDKGWGCAYRSLQTLCSWFITQKYTSKTVPSHRQIQQVLVDLGDKDKGFVGSNKWIGATELMYVLDTYMGISSKVIFIPRGADIPSHARELAQHFRTQGTPVMIGGGVLAYTLLGVHFNEQTGDCAFLILDPHYTGGEDLKKVQAGTWVAWKRPGDNAAAGGPLFVQDAFYNFLCPQRPNTV